MADGGWDIDLPSDEDSKRIYWRASPRMLRHLVRMYPRCQYPELQDMNDIVERALADWIRAANEDPEAVMERLKEQAFDREAVEAAIESVWGDTDSD